MAHVRHHPQRGWVADPGHQAAGPGPGKRTLAEGLATAALVSPLVGAPIWAMITLASAVLLRLRAFGWLPVALLGMATFGALTRTEIGSISLPFGAVSALLFRMALALQRPEAI